MFDASSFRSQQVLPQCLPLRWAAAVLNLCWRKGEWEEGSSRGEEGAEEGEWGHEDDGGAACLVLVVLALQEFGERTRVELAHEVVEQPRLAGVVVGSREGEGSGQQVDRAAVLCLQGR